MRALTLAVLLTGCSPYSLGGATTPPLGAFGPSRADAGTVCVVRSSPWAQAVTFVVHDNQTLVGATRGESYFCYEAEPGEHVIVSDTFDSVDRPAKIVARLEPGARYWLRQDHENHFGSVRSHLVWMTPEEAAAAIRGCAYRPISRAPAHEPLPPPVPFAVAMR